MPGNEVGDTIHNFFPHEKPQGQNHLPSLDGYWPVPGNNVWAGSQRPVASVNPSPKNYNIQKSDSEREQIGLHLHRQHGLNFAQSAARPEFGTSQPRIQPAKFNGFMYGNQLFQSRQDETNFMEGVTNASQLNQTSKGIFMYGSPNVNGPENEPGPSVRGEASGSPVRIDFLGGQQQVNYQQLNMLQSLQLQQSRLNDMQQSPQQVMFTKMQEFQRQQQLQQADAQQQNIPSQIPAFAKQASGNHSLSMINGSQNADGLGYNWASELGNTNSFQRNTPSLQGSSGGLAFSPNQSPARRAVNFVPQQVEQSLYGVPVSDSRSSWNQYPPLFADRCAVQQVTALGNHTSGTQYNAFPGQVNVQDGLLLGKQRSQGENSFGPVSGQTLSLLQVENLQQVNSLQGSVSQQEFHDRQVVDVECETLQGKAEKQITSSQEDVALDPTEERILFGSDDNIWAAFGKSTGTDGESGNLFDGAVFSGSIQGGTWSALMQSAVAETSSGDQEEWSGLSFQTTPVNESIRVGNEPVRVDSDGGNESVREGDGGRPMHLEVDNLPKASSMSWSEDINVKKNYPTVLGLQQFGTKFPSESGLMLQVNSSKGVDQFSSRQSDAIPAHNLIAGASLVHGNASHSLNPEIRKGTSSLWIPETSGSRQEVSKLEGENIFGSVMPHEDADVMVHGREGSLKHSWGNDQMHVMRREVLQSGNHEWANSRVSSAELEQVKPSAGDVQGNNEGFHLTSPAMMDSSSTMTGQGSDNFPQGNYNFNYWKHADSVVNSEVNEAVGGIQLDNKSPNKEGKGHHKENSDKQENSNDRCHSNSSRGASTAVPWESASIDVNESRIQSAGTHKSNQTGRKNSALRKFQYHPMGNLNDDVESPNGFKQPMHSEAMAQFGQPKFYGQMPKNSAEMGKELPPGHHRSIRGFDEVLVPDNFAGSPVSNLTPSNQTSDIQEPNRGSHSSQNMLGLLQKVDGSGEDDVRIRSSLQNSSSVLPQAENCDQSVGWLQRSQSSNSQGFGLHLGPPLKHSLPNHALTSQSFLQIPNSSHSSRACPDTAHEGAAQLVPESHVHSVPASSDRFQGISNTESSGLPGQPGDAMSSHNQMSGNYSTNNTGFPYSSGQLQNQETICGSGQMARSPKKEASAAWKGEFNSRPCISHSAEASLPDKGGSSHDNNASTKNTSPHFSTNFSLERVSGTPPLPVSQSQSIVGSSSLGSSKSNSNLGTNMPAQQHLLRSQLQKMTSQFPQPNQPKIVNSSSPASFGQTDGDARNQGTFCFEFPAGSVNLTGVGPEGKQSVKEGTVQQVLPGNVNLVQKNNESHDKVPAVVRTQSDGYPENSISSHRDIDTSDRPLKPNSLFQKKCSLNQMHAVRNLGNDPRPQVLKRMEGQGSHLGSQRVALRAGQTNGCDGMTVGAAVPINRMSSGETTLLSFSGPAKNADKSSTSEHGSVTRQGMFMLNQDHSESGSGSARVLDHSQISPQMAPSWFNQYGTFKNEQMVPVHYARLASTVKSGEQLLNEVSNIQESAPSSSVVAEHLSSQGLPASVDDQHKVIMRTKKRKSATSELHPWHEEVQQASRDLGNISMAEFEWSKAANRLTQKVEEDVEEGPPLFRSKRRLILTTQLMQQLFRPPSAAIISMDANSHYETLIYSVSRVALGDACRMVSSANWEANMPNDCRKRLSDECTTSTRLDQHLLKVTEEFTARARKLGNDFLRLNKGASVSDLIVECQDLERFLVINRFAKFHGRSQAENAETASSSDAESNLKPCPQRYVTALPLPRNLPMAVQCHSM